VSDVEEIIQWDRKLCQTKTFSTALLILLGLGYNSPKLADQKKILLKFINKPAEEYFRRRSKQVTGREAARGNMTTSRA
jgi:hypothetical protein